MEKDYIGNIWVDPHTAAIFRNGEEQDFVVFDEYVMLVEKKGRVLRTKRHGEAHVG
jgi:hypothetical protein